MSDRLGWGLTSLAVPGGSVFLLAPHDDETPDKRTDQPGSQSRLCNHGERPWLLAVDENTAVSPMSRRSGGPFRYATSPKGSSSAGGELKELHEHLTVLIAVYVPLHLGGVVLAELTSHPGLVSEMIYGKAHDARKSNGG